MQTFSYMWTPELAAALRQAADTNGPYVISTPVGSAEYDILFKSVNKGIDAHLEACFVPSRGDRFVHKGGRLECALSPESLVVLVRRLMESDDEEGESLASDICSSLEIELI